MARGDEDIYGYTADQVAYMRHQMAKVRKSLLEGYRDGEGVWHPPADPEKVPSVDEMFRLRMVAAAYTDDERNDKVDFEVHSIFLAIRNKADRQALLHSRDDWTEATAQAAVERYQPLIDGSRRLLDDPDRL